MKRKMRAQEMDSRVLKKVFVLIDLPRDETRGGHMRVWEKFAATAAARPDLPVDLTLITMARQRSEESLSDKVRIIGLPPVLSSHHLPFLRAMPSETDLAGWHPALAAMLVKAQVIHTTDAFFCMAQTAEKVAAKHHIPLVHSIHTDTPNYTRIFTRQLIDSHLGFFGLNKWLNDFVQMPEKSGKNKDQQLQNHLKKCRHVWHGPVAGPMPAPARHGLRSSSYLRRGIDKEFFNPARRDQAWLRQRFRLPDHHTILLSVGRLDASKNIHVVADSVRIARDNGLAVHWLAVGQGAEAGALRQKLGPHITLPGMIEGKELAKTYASADIFLFPAVHEITPNVVLEAKASGLPCLLASGSALYVARSGHDAVLLPDVLPPTWAAEIGRFAAQPKVLEAIGLAARRDIDDHRPSWADVIQQDLLPVWLAT